ncbi:saccharopine dehydrogenase NADP-binding domain-containing protein [Micromonospora sp. DR5-3]|uniref:saccharopine dehydrogenase NADP-binding domain-containing protein n=1 Tax=unclassified Micromonospora TaxID=2617518 RepID=UPI0016525766|nr:MULTISPECIES: saccharopine dehydrogenase NADP-binding domain-containing protein [unclassified Micromonospora]MCW3819602.1 saccharopine dehydrogenase NADP-binding domain-containing protein [Micromonospora sp. DR5-3]
MSGRSPVTVVGATGAVGRAAAGFLHRAGLPLRLVGRRQAALRSLAGKLAGPAYGPGAATGNGPASGPAPGPGAGPAAMPVAVAVADVTDSDALAGACAGSGIVVNCAGPATAVGPRVAVAADAAGAHYVDAAGDDLLDGQLAAAGLPGPGRVAVLAAGMSPGLTGLLPRLLAGPPFTRVERLTGYAGGRDRFTPAAATDYLASLTDGYGLAGAAWRDGRVVAGALTPRLDEPAPFFPGLVSAFPYLSGELRRAAADLVLVEASWFNVFDGEHTLALLGRLRTGTGDGTGTGVEPGEAARQLCHAAELDAAGLRSYQLFVLELTGVTDAGPLTRTLVARAPDAYLLSGAVAALAALAVADGELPPGRHRADAVLPPERTVRRLGDWGALLSVDVSDVAVAAAAEVEEGVL